MGRCELDVTENWWDEILILETGTWGRLLCDCERLIGIQYSLAMSS
jgi:hypothetical protein